MPRIDKSIEKEISKPYARGWEEGEGGLMANGYGFLFGAIKKGFGDSGNDCTIS